MFRRRRGAWVNFGSRNPKEGTVLLASSCISTSAESAGHLTTVLSTGKIVGVNDKIKGLRQNVRDGFLRDQA